MLIHVKDAPDLVIPRRLVPSSLRLFRQDLDFLAGNFNQLLGCGVRAVDNFQMNQRGSR